MFRCFSFFMDSGINEVVESIKSVESEILEVETLLKKRKWNKTEHEAFGSKGELRGKEKQLREKERQLREKELKLLDNRNQVKVTCNDPYFQGSFLPCAIPFYKDFAEFREEGDWLEMKHCIPSSKLTQMYIRTSYRAIALSILNEKDHWKTIVSGTPGVGKSLFMIYLLSRLIRHKQRVLFVYHPHKVYFDGKGSVLDVSVLPSPSNVEFWDSTLWCLFDCKFKKPEDLNSYEINECRFVLSFTKTRYGQRLQKTSFAYKVLYANLG